MTVSTDVLRTLHRIHRSISDLNERLERGPRQIRASQGKLAQKEEELVAAKDALMQTRKKYDQKSLTLKTREQHIVSLQGKLNTCASNKEFQLLKDQINADEKANLVLQDEILEVLEKIDQREDAIKTIEAEIAEAKQNVDEVAKRVRGEQGVLEEDLARVNAERVEAEKDLPADFKREYDRVVNTKGEDALAVVDGDCCTGCHTKITMNHLSDLMLNKPIFCRTCGAFLYLPEDRSV